MITVLFAHINNLGKSEVLDLYLQEMPLFLQSNILKLKSTKDRERSLIGKMLLRESLSRLNIQEYSLKDLKFNKFKRPYFAGDFDFNISHSNEIIICAISRTRIGVDVEEIQQIQLSDFDNQLSREDSEEIRKAEEKLRAFFKVWTRKEAFAKALGDGLTIPFSSIKVSDDRISWKGTEWFFRGIDINKDYVVSVCSQLKSCEIFIEEIEF